jgi:hypothetical protein
MSLRDDERKELTDEPAEARRIARKLEFHYTLQLGSWLNMIEIEFSVLSQQCLDRRIPINIGGLLVRCGET